MSSDELPWNEASAKQCAGFLFRKTDLTDDQLTLGRQLQTTTKRLRSFSRSIMRNAMSSFIRYDYDTC
jgi:hypothetical protein